jgi:hypothetical protein
MAVQNYFGASLSAIRKRENEVFNPVTMETCPQGYRRPAQVITPGVYLDHEIAITTEGVRGGYTGYYADGYFDRRKHTPTESGVNTTSPDMAVGGVLRVNLDDVNGPHYGASIFFPYAGYIGCAIYTDRVVEVDYYIYARDVPYAYYWATAARQWGIVVNIGSTSAQSHYGDLYEYVKKQLSPIRCVLIEE